MTLVVIVVARTMTVMMAAQTGMADDEDVRMRIRKKDDEDHDDAKGDEKWRGRR